MEGRCDPPMAVVTLEVRMEGEAQGVKEIAAMELEAILRKIGWAEVRCTGVREERERQESLWNK